MPPCTPWLTADRICTDLTGVDQAIIDRELDVAVDWLYDATCGQYPGTCASVIRPCLPCRHGGGCRCHYERLDLTPYVPGAILAATEVLVDGEVVNEADYRIDNRRFLVPIDGGALDPWPVQRMDYADDAVDTWSIAVEHGRPVPSPLVAAAAWLAEQLVLRCIGDECELPDNATSLSKDGVSIELRVPAGGETGIPMVDTIVGQYGCRHARRMLDPAAPRAAVTRVV